MKHNDRSERQDGLMQKMFIFNTSDLMIKMLGIFAL